MKCPKCGCETSKVNGSKATKAGYVRRRRICSECGESYSTLEIREDVFSEITGYAPGKPLKKSKKSIKVDKPEAATSDSNIDLTCLSGINKKLNILARAFAETIEHKSNDGIQPKKHKSHSLDVSLEEYEQDIASDLASIETDPDPSDIHAWAVLIASLA